MRGLNPRRLSGQWRRWTGAPFDTDGPAEAPAALAPVRCHGERGHAGYVGPDVRIRSPL
ncbi:hypothetical protein AB0K81_31275 [Streptomyces werraensis]|uniref:Uncharacterized protein n=1 Tax=Streptomyces werraensis TaxID=68284 RepID=A0ABV3JNJ5_9ACTN